MLKYLCVVHESLRRRLSPKERRCGTIWHIGCGPSTFEWRQTIRRSLKNNGNLEGGMAARMRPGAEESRLGRLIFFREGRRGFCRSFVSRKNLTLLL